MSSLSKEIFHFNKQKNVHCINSPILANVIFSYVKRGGKLSASRNVLSIITSKEVIIFKHRFMFGYLFEDIKYDKINSISVHKNLLGYTVVLVFSGSYIKLKWEKYGDIEKYIKYLQLYRNK